jgi:hypothetical protein
MRGKDEQPLDVFSSYISAEERVPEDHPLRLLRPSKSLLMSGPLETLNEL